MNKKKLERRILDNLHLAKAIAAGLHARIPAGVDNVAAREVL